MENCLLILALLIIVVLLGFLCNKLWNLSNIGSDNLLLCIGFIGALIVVICLFPSIQKLQVGKDGVNIETRVNEVEKNVDRLQNQINDILLLTVLDSFEYVTLKKISSQEYSDLFRLRPSANNMLIRLRNRNLIEEVHEERKFLTQVEDPDFPKTEEDRNSIDWADEKNNTINLRQYVKITTRGREYFELINKFKDFDEQLEDNAQKYLKRDKLLNEQEQKS